MPRGNDDAAAREHIVVAVSAADGDEAVIRRAARLASSTAAPLDAVHVARSSRFNADGSVPAVGLQTLVESLGGTFHTVVADSVADAVADLAQRVGATQIVVGATAPGRRPARRTVADRIAARTDVDLHVVSRIQWRSAPGRVPLPALDRGLSWQRRVLGLVISAVLLPVLTVAATALRAHLTLAADVPLYLLVVVLTSLVGGFVPAIVSALAAALLLNYYFAPPVHTLSIDRASDIVAVLVFLLIALAVSRLVDIAARRADHAARAGAEAQALTAFAAGLLRGELALPSMLRRVRDTFAMDGAALLRAERDGWHVVAADGTAAPRDPRTADANADLGDHLHLAVHGHPLGDADQRIFAAVAGHVAAAYRQQQLVDAARAAEQAAESDRQRTALLNAVGHDLRTPIASAKVAVGSLRAAEVAWSAADRAELLATAEDALDRLTDLVTNLLDLSRLQVGAVAVLPSAVGLDDVVARALEHLPRDAPVAVDVPADLPEALADAGLLERVVANIVQNALRYTPAGTQVRLVGSAHRDQVQLRVVDRGPGIAGDLADAAFRPFQRADDGGGDGAGVGLGLAIARGFTEAMDGTVAVEQTPGGGATFVITVQVAP
ncbi:DUF4118 domain-containing protein [uncultured Jatrophihabitans sp.]|uniref:DUF4118 domain-containing protein n=1 Tax=uncultured Jatrophihabitans sp. TaxID=1610747 RepID=UPI0035CBB9C3